jgi:hypothetical protein
VGGCYEHDALLKKIIDAIEICGWKTRAGRCVEANVSTIRVPSRAKEVADMKSGIQMLKLYLLAFATGEALFVYRVEGLPLGCLGGVCVICRLLVGARYASVC